MAKDNICFGQLFENFMCYSMAWQFLCSWTAKMVSELLWKRFVLLCHCPACWKPDKVGCNLVCGCQVASVYKQSAWGSGDPSGLSCCDCTVSSFYCCLWAIPESYRAKVLRGSPFATDFSLKGFISSSVTESGKTAKRGWSGSAKAGPLKTFTFDKVNFSPDVSWRWVTVSIA